MRKRVMRTTGTAAEETVRYRSARAGPGWWAALPRLLERELAERGWSVSELARRAHVSVRSVQEVLNRERPPSLRLLCDLAEAVERDPVELFAITLSGDEEWAGKEGEGTREGEEREAGEAEGAPAHYPRMPVHPDLTAVVTIADRDRRLRELIRAFAYLVRGFLPETPDTRAAAEDEGEASTRASG